MRIVEILLSKKISNKELSPKAAREIDALQTRIDSYVDKILDPNTSSAGKEFLKSRLRDDYHELKLLLPQNTFVAEDSPIRYEVFDRETGNNIPGHNHYTDKILANKAADQLDNAYGAYKHGYRRAHVKLKEAVHKLPLTHDDFEMVKHIMSRPIPAVIAPIFISDVINDDELNDQLLSLEEFDPAMDVRPLIAEWFERVMPDQKYRFTGETREENQKKGLLSPIHGYDPKMYKGTNDPVTGNAYGRY